MCSDCEFMKVMKNQSTSLLSLLIATSDFEKQLSPY